jgi:Mg2+ and Co2+ transporter CorA
LDSKVGDLRARIQMHAQDKTNHRIAVLTVFSAIFVPLTLMAGIWGMNFEVMPELKSAIGYPRVLGAMILVGRMMYLFFRRGGWFDQRQLRTGAGPSCGALTPAAGGAAADEGEVSEE